MTTTTTPPITSGALLRHGRRLGRLLIAAIVAGTVLGSWLVVRARYASGLLIGDDAAGDPAPVRAAWALWVLVTAATAWGWAVWAGAVRSRLTRLGRRLSHPGWWDTAGWLVPPYCWFAPAAATAALWRESTPGPERRGSRTVAVWWVLYLVGNPVVVATAAALGAWRVAVWSMVAWLAAGLLALRLVGRITTRSLMLEEMEGGTGTGWRRMGRLDRAVPAVVGMIAVVGFVGYQGFAISEALVGALNGWQVEDAEAGMCFGGVAGERIAAVIDLPCGEPHLGEVVGSHLLQGAREGGWNEPLLETFAEGICRTSAEAYTGVRAEDLSESLVVTWPTRADWDVYGDRDVTCLLLVPEGTVGSVADPDGARVAHRSLRSGDCFVDDPGWSTARRAGCTPPAVRVTGFEVLDRTLTAPHPGNAAFERVAARACPEGATVDAPSVVEWQRGNRVLLCTEHL